MPANASTPLAPTWPEPARDIQEDAADLAIADGAGVLDEDLRRVLLLELNDLLGKFDER